MTQQEREEQLLIDKFMGITPTEYENNTLRYKTSWDWLHPVYRKVKIALGTFDGIDSKSLLSLKHRSAMNTALISTEPWAHRMSYEAVLGGIKFLLHD